MRTMYATTFFTFESDGVEIAGDPRSRLEWRVARRADEIARMSAGDMAPIAWQVAEQEILSQLPLK
ncbi:MAG: hypothetical protein JWM32_1261 [Verrucomicrobia bacterium]|nr:hypothetical protein [Verrucomicrobiota bacterium]